MSKEIVIVGAGATGLMAASRLSGNGNHITVVEARDRIGGRIHALRSLFSIPVEAGAEFMHGKQSRTTSLAEEAESGLSPLRGNHYQVYHGDFQRGDFFDAQWEELTKALATIKKDVDMATFLDEHFKGDQYADLRQRVKGFAEGFDAADLDRVSAMALKDEWMQADDDAQYHIEGGYSKLMNYLESQVREKGVEFLLSSPVSGIQWSRNKAKITIGTGRILEAEKVLITVPLGVLKKNLIEFDPPLPRHHKAFQQMGYGSVIKIFLEFRSPFWEALKQRSFRDVAFIFSDASIPTWWSQLPDRTPLLTGWLGGPAAREAEHDAEKLLEKAMASLQYVFSCARQDLTRELLRWHVSDWVKDPWALGAYAYPTIGTRQAVAFLQEGIGDTLYFAGEALYQGPALGTVEAALASGSDAAQKIQM